MANTYNTPMDVEFYVFISPKLQYIFHQNENAITVNLNILEWPKYRISAEVEFLCEKSGLPIRYKALQIL